MSYHLNAVISLGSNCHVATQCKTYLKHTNNSFFDWLVTPFLSIEKVFDDEAVQAASKMRVEQNGKSVICEMYDVLYHHEYPRSKEGFIRFSVDDIEKSRSKLRHKTDSMLSTMRFGRPLFIRYGIATDVPNDAHANRPLKYSNINSLVAKLRRICGHDDFHFLLIELKNNLPECVEKDEALSMFASHQTTDFHREKHGNPEFWLSIFKEFGLECKSS